MDERVSHVVCDEIVTLTLHASRDTASTWGVEIVDVEASVLYNLNHLLHLECAVKVGVIMEVPLPLGEGL